MLALLASASCLFNQSTNTMTASTRDHLPREQDQLLRLELLRMAAAEQPLSVRALYYRAVLNPALPFITKDKGNDRRNERLVQSRCLALRRAGEMPWSWIVDPSRASYEADRWAGPAAFADVAPWYYRRDLWAGQGQRPVVLVEKAAAIGTVLQHCNQAGVDVWATKGYGSASQLKDLAEQLHPLLELGQSVVALVLADFDPSGWGWPQAAETEIRSHIRRLGPVLGELSFERVLMTQEQAEELGDRVALRPPNTADARTLGFLDAHGIPYERVGKEIRCSVECCVELDALSPTEVRSLLTERFEGLFDGDIAGELEQQRADRDRIREALASLA